LFGFQKSIPEVMAQQRRNGINRWTRRYRTGAGGRGRLVVLMGLVRAGLVWAGLVGVGLVWAAALGCRETPARAPLAAEFERLHRRVYDVYALGADRDAVWTHLAGTFAGDALTHEYLEHFTTLERMRRDGTSIQVVSVDYEGIVTERRRGETWVAADWSVGGVVTHQGHRHPRVNRYRASYRVGQGSDGEARILETEVRRFERVRNADLGAFPLDTLPRSGRGFMSLTDLLKQGVVDLGEVDGVAAEGPGTETP
jgi:hypothetical protein